MVEIGRYVRGQPRRSMLYYDNGRVKMRIKYQHGKEIKVNKFDNPRPTVLIEVEANAELYKSWQHTVPDAFPKPRNLKQVQSHSGISRVSGRSLRTEQGEAVERQVRRLELFRRYNRVLGNGR